MRAGCLVERIRRHFPEGDDIGRRGQIDLAKERHFDERHLDRFQQAGGSLQRLQFATLQIQLQQRAIGRLADAGEQDVESARFDIHGLCHGLIGWADEQRTGARSIRTSHGRSTWRGCEGAGVE